MARKNDSLQVNSKKEVHTSKRILVVDDEKDICDALKSILERQGFIVDTANDGMQAMNIIDDGMVPDLIVLDVEMPDMNGYTFMFELYREEKRRSIPVIVVSAYSEMQPIFSHRGVKDYLIKPTKPEDLLKKIRQHLKLDQAK